MVYALVLSIMAVVFSHPKLLDQNLDPVLPTPLSEVDQVNPEVYTGNFDWSGNNDESSIKPLPLLPHGYRELWERKNFNHGKLLHLTTFSNICCLIKFVLMNFYFYFRGHEFRSGGDNLFIHNGTFAIVWSN